MQVQDAQREVRTVFVGGFWGQLVSSALWLASAALGTWMTPRAAIFALVVSGFFIFPLTQLLLRLTGRPASLPRGLASRITGKPEVNCCNHAALTLKTAQ